MNKVMQVARDDCMRACLATYFGLTLAEVPGLETEQWHHEVRDFAHARGLGYVTIKVPNEEVFRESFSGGFLICTGESARGMRHAVIYKDGELWHDPHPGSTGIKAVEQVDFFYLLNPPGGA